MRFQFDFGRSPGGRSRDDAFRILVLGDVMGDRASEAALLSERRVAALSVDTIDEVFARYRPSLSLPALEPSGPLTFDSLDDFHPDRLYARVPVFGRLRSLRQRLQDPSTFAAAAAELTSDASPAPRPATSTSADRPDALFERLLGTPARQDPAADRVPAVPSSIDDYLHAIVAPYISAAPDPQLPQLLSAVDAALTDAMRALLHDGAFQQLEALWRGVHWLLTTIGDRDESDLEIGLLHVARGEIAADDQLETVLARWLERGATDDHPPSLIVCAHAFGATVADLALVERLGALGIARDVAILAGAQGSLVGCEDPVRQSDPTTWTALPEGIAKVWADVRSTPGASVISLAWPRLLLRLPYGRKTDPIESFAFEEISTSHAHDDYLWSNGAFALALAVARVHLGESDEIAGDITDLPAFVYEREGERVLKPCAELVLSERAFEEASARGVTPLLSYRNRNAVRLAGLQSIAMPTE